MSHFKAKMHQIRFPASVRLSRIGGVWHYASIIFPPTNEPTKLPEATLWVNSKMLSEIDCLRSPASWLRFRMLFAGGRSPKRRSGGGSGLRVTDPSDLYRCETSRRTTVDRRSRDQDAHHRWLTDSALPTENHPCQVISENHVSFTLGFLVSYFNFYLL